MKYQILLVITLSLSCQVLGQTPTEQANELINQKKYESAFGLLEEADPKNDDPEMAIAKTYLLLNYFVTSIMHNLFALTDLKEDQDIMDVRGTEGSFSMFMFEADSILHRLITKFPKNYALRKALGRYYHEVHLKYGTNSTLPEEEIMDGFLENYLVAFENGVYDEWSSYGIGYAYVSKGEYQKSIPFFEKAIELKSDYPTSHYNLAIAYLYSDRREEAISSALEALKLYTEPEMKADAARIVAVVYAELGDDIKALEYYRISNEIGPSNYYTLRPMLALAVKTSAKDVQNLMNEFVNLAPRNPTIYKDMVEIYSEEGRQADLATLLEGKLVEFADDPGVLGNIHLFRGILLKGLEEYDQANAEFANAKLEFLKVYESDHQVFEAIESYLSEEKSSEE